MQEFDLGPLEPFDHDRAIDLPQACKFMKGRFGPLSVHMARRWASQGYHRDGWVLYLPAVRLGRIWLMESWVRAFEAARQRLCNPPRAPLRSARLVV